MRKSLCYLIYLLFLIVSCKKEIRNNNFENIPQNILEKKTIDSIYNHVSNGINDSVNRERLFEIAGEYDNKELYEESKQTLEVILNRASEKYDTLHQAKVFWYLGNVYDNQEKLDTSFLYYSKAEFLYQTTKRDSLNWARMISYKAGILYKMGISTESEVLSIKALHILNRLKNTRLIYENYLRIALNLKDLKQYDEALKYYLKLPDLLNQLEVEGYNVEKLERSWLSYYNNLSSFFNNRKEYSKGKFYAIKGLSLRYVINYPKLHALLLNNLAISEIYLNNQKGINKTIDSLLYKGLEIRKDINHVQGIIGSKITIGEYLLLKKDTANALINIKDAYGIAINSDVNNDLLKCLELLSLIDKKNQNLHVLNYHKTRDSLHDLERATRNKFARIAFHTEEIEAKNTILLKRTFYYGAAALLFFLLGVSSFFVYRLRLRNKKLEYQRTEQSNIQKIQELLYEQDLISQNVRTEERDRIAKDLHDAVINRIFTTRLNLSKLNITDTIRKSDLINELVLTENQIREISHDLHHSLFNQKQNYASVLENLVTKQKNSFNTQFACTIDSQINWNEFDLNFKTQLYLILQELLQNVNKHSQATNCYVFILKVDELLTVRVHDNGVGIKNKKDIMGIGFKSIQSRVIKLNATFSLKQHNEMTTVEILIPKSFC